MKRLTYKDLVRSVPIFGTFAIAAYRMLRQPRRFAGSAAYWEQRYREGGNSGSGSYNRLAAFKASVLNKFVEDHCIESVVELGCGDGAQLALASYPRYVGYDVSPRAVDICRARFSADRTKQFHLMTDLPPVSGDLALSLDVIFHLIEDNVFEQYMTQLFSCGEKFVIIYSSNTDAESPAPHVRHRCFARWVEARMPGWSQIAYVPNDFPFDEREPSDTSFSDFFVYRRR
jgi:SAM-dependent methyltransferase